MTSTFYPQQQWMQDHAEQFLPGLNVAGPSHPAQIHGNQTYGSQTDGNQTDGNQTYSQTQPVPPFVGRGSDSADIAPIRGGRRVDQGRFWVGAVLTAVVAGLASVIGMVVAQDLLRVPLPLTEFGMSGAHIGTYGLLVGVVALLAAVAFDGMMAFAPRPPIYYGTLTGLLTALAVLLPFTAAVALTSQLALAAINLVVGVLIMTLVPIAASNANGRH